MKRLRWHPIAAATVALAVSVACGDGDGVTDVPVPAVPVPGTLVLSLTSPNSDDGAILLSISGGGITAPTVASTSHVLFSRLTGTTSINAVVVGNITAGPLLRFDVPDVGGASAYTGTITEVADRANALRTTLTGYSLEISQ